MELKTLRSFAALAREGSVSAAAISEHISQPALSRQLSALEAELGCTLYTRGKKGIKLTPDGSALLHYAQRMLAIADEAEERFAGERDAVDGTVRIGCGDSASFRLVAQAAQGVRALHPGVRFHFHGGTSAELLGGLTKGFYDFVLECEARKHVEFNILQLPVRDSWALLVRAEGPLGALDAATPADLEGQVLIASRQALKSHVIKHWAGESYGAMRFSATFSIGFNVFALVEQGLGSAFVYRELLQDCVPPGLRLVPLAPAVESEQALLWRKMALSPAAQALLDELELAAQEG